MLSQSFERSTVSLDGSMNSKTRQHTPKNHESRSNISFKAGSEMRYPDLSDEVDITTLSFILLET